MSLAIRLKSSAKARAHKSIQRLAANDSEPVSEISPIYPASAPNDSALSESIILLQETERARLRAVQRFTDLELQIMEGSWEPHTDSESSASGTYCDTESGRLSSRPTERPIPPQERRRQAKHHPAHLGSNHPAILTQQGATEAPLEPLISTESRQTPSQNRESPVQKRCAT